MHNDMVIRHNGNVYAFYSIVHDQKIIGHGRKRVNVFYYIMNDFMIIKEFSGFMNVTVFWE